MLHVIIFFNFFLKTAFFRKSETDFIELLSLYQKEDFFKYDKYTLDNLDTVLENDNQNAFFTLT